MSKKDSGSRLHLDESGQIGTNYQYLANVKSYFLGVRTNYVKWGLIGLFGLFTVGGTILVVLGGLCWVTVGYLIDMKQREKTTNFMEGWRAWRKIKNVVIKDQPGGVLKVFSKGKE